MARTKLIKQATNFLIKTNGDGISQQLKQKWLMEKKGLTMTEYLEALNNATNGEVLRSAFGELK